MTAAILGIVVPGGQLNIQAFNGIFLIFSGLPVLVSAGRNITRGATR